MPKSEIAKRESAIQRGLMFIYDFACEPNNFLEHGSGLLCCFENIATTALDPKLRRTSFRLGREKALQWRANCPSLPKKLDEGTIIDYMMASDAADRLGVPDPHLKQRLRESASRFSVNQYLDFDPANEPPPTDLPEECECGASNARRRKRCGDCRKSLAIISRYRVWYYALSYVVGSERYGINLGAQSEDLLKWLPSLRPYRGRENDTNDEFLDCVYAITHLVYALNDYNVFSLSPRALPEEFTFLKENLAEAIDMEDADMVGEIVDCLKAFGLRDTNPLIRAGREYLLDSQNADGSWGELDADSYTRYHSTWTGIDGLRDFDWQPKLRRSGLVLLRIKKTLSL